jgi:hypothetical protein
LTIVKTTRQEDVSEETTGQEAVSGGAESRFF